MIAVDTETRNLRWWEGSAFLGTWSGTTRDGLEYDRAAQFVEHPGHERPGAPRTERFINTLVGHNVLVMHNAKFDSHQLRVTLGYDVYENGHTIHDTLIMSKVVIGNQRWDHSLEGLSTDFLPGGGKQAEKAAISEIYRALSGRTSMAHDDAFWDVWVEDPEALEKYAMADTNDTLALYHWLLPQLEEDERLMAVYEQEMKVQRVLYDAERRGVRVDPKAVTRLAVHHQDIEIATARVLEAELGVPPSSLEGAGSEEMIRDCLLAAGVPLTELTESGDNLAVNQYVLAKHGDHPAVDALLRWRSARKFQTTYLEPLQNTEFVHTDFMQAEAKTSRMSSRRPNLQNLPKRRDTDGDKNMRVRSVYVPRDGFEFIVSDYDQVEPRVFAWFNGVPEYRQVVAEGRTYLLAAAAAWGGTPEEYAKGGPKHFLYPAAKMIYLAILYGGGGKAIRDQNNAMTPPEFHLDVDWVKDPDNMFDTPPDSQALKKRIVATIPGYFDLCSTNARYPGRIFKACQKNGYVRTIMGRKQWVPKDKEGKPMYYQVPNHLIQASAAEIMKQGAINVAAALEPHGGYPLLFVHDEIVCEVPKGKGEELAPVVVNAMESAYPLDPPLSADWSVTDRSYAHA